MNAAEIITDRDYTDAEKAAWGNSARTITLTNSQWLAVICALCTAAIADDEDGYPYLAKEVREVRRAISEVIDQGNPYK